jgi:hypothetical protein
MKVILETCCVHQIRYIKLFNSCSYLCTVCLICHSFLVVCGLIEWRPVCACFLLFFLYLYRSVGWFMLLNATFHNISVIKAASFIGGGNRSTHKKPPACRK